MKIKLIKTISLTLSAVCLAFLCSCSLGNESSLAESTQAVTQTESLTAAQTEPLTTAQPTTLSAEQQAEQKLDEMLQNMTLEEKVGQMFYVRCPETDATEAIATYHVGGYVLFGRDFDGKTKDEVVSNIQSYQAASKIPMLIGVDEEGGTVVRVSDNQNLCDSPFLSPKDTYANGGWTAVEQDATDKADLLLSLGINVNMAPVCDITSDSDAFMYQRSFSDDVDEVCTFVQKTVAISKQKHLGTVLKHFPGYGDNTDTHTGMAYDDREYSEFVESDFKPFIAGIEAGADSILAAHNIVSSMDSEYPASLSAKVHDIIRTELNFDGVIMTDDLAMDAVTEYTGNEAAAVLAAKCGNDVLCCSDIESQYPAVLEAVQNGEIPESQIDASVKRILKWKSNLGLI